VSSQCCAERRIRSEYFLLCGNAFLNRDHGVPAPPQPRSLTSLTASSSHARLNFLLRIPTLQFRQTPYLVVHGTGSRPRLDRHAERGRASCCCQGTECRDPLVEVPDFLALQVAKKALRFADKSAAKSLSIKVFCASSFLA